MKQKSTSKEEARELRRNLRRDPQFKEELAESYGVSQVPKELHERLEQTYLSLPDELIVKKNPWRTAMTRTMGSLAAVAAVFALLIGLGVISPVVLQRIPGFSRFVGSTSTVSEYEIPAGFAALPVTDNGTILYDLALDSTGTDTTLQVSAVIPYMGQESYDVLRYEDSTPYGVYAVFSAYNQWNTVVKAQPDNISNQQPLETDSSLLYIAGDAMGISDAFTVQWQIDLSQLQLSKESQVTLTLYELREPTSRLNHVTAEFTIDIASLSAQVSNSYEEQGYEKITPEECLETVRNDTINVTQCEPVIVVEDESIAVVVEVFIQADEMDEVPGLTVAKRSEDGEETWHLAGGELILQEYTDARRTGQVYDHLVFTVTDEAVLGNDLTALAAALNASRISLYLAHPNTGEPFGDNLYFSYALHQHDPM